MQRVEDLEYLSATPFPAALPADEAKQRDWLTVVLFSVYLCGVAAYIYIWGLPHSADTLFLVITTGLIVASVRTLPTSGRQLVVDWLPFVAVMIAYDMLRGYAGHPLTAPHTMPQLNADKWLFGGVVPTVRLQQALYRPGHLQWWDYLAWLIHISHFFVTFVVAAVLWKKARPRFRRFTALFLMLTFLGFVTYVLFPAVPPWLASVNGQLQPTTRIIETVWLHVGIQPASAILENGSRYVNEVAAIPSLHAAFPMLLLLFFWRSKPWVRAVLFAYLILMALTLTYTAEHYVVDILIGWAYAAGVVIIGDRLLDRRARRASARRRRLSAVAAVSSP